MTDLKPCPFFNCHAHITLRPRQMEQHPSEEQLVIHKCDIVKSTMVCTVSQWNDRIADYVRIPQ